MNRCNKNTTTNTSPRKPFEVPCSTLGDNEGVGDIYTTSSSSPRFQKKSHDQARSRGGVNKILSRRRQSVEDLQRSLGNLFRGSRHLVVFDPRGEGNVDLRAVKEMLDERREENIRRSFELLNVDNSGGNSSHDVSSRILDGSLTSLFAEENQEKQTSSAEFDLSFVDVEEQRKLLDSFNTSRTSTDMTWTTAGIG